MNVAVFYRVTFADEVVLIARRERLGGESRLSLAKVGDPEAMKALEDRTRELVQGMWEAQGRC